MPDRRRVQGEVQRCLSSGHKTYWRRILHCGSSTNPAPCHPVLFILLAQVYLAQSLYKAGMYPEATRAAVRVDSPQYQQRMIALQVQGDYGVILSCCVPSIEYIAARVDYGPAKQQSMPHDTDQQPMALANAPRVELFALVFRSQLWWLCQIIRYQSLNINST